VPDGISEQRRPKQDKILPPILSKEEIKTILDTENNPKHRLHLMLVYSSGLRVSEVVAFERYAQVALKNVLTVKSPLDTII
jgi:site-specific recombinase XerD